MQIIDLSQLKSVITVKSGGFDLFYYNGDKPIRRSLFRVDEKSCLLPLPASGNKLIIIAVPLPETEVEDKNYAEVDQTNVAVHLDQYQRFFEKHKLPKLEKLPKKIDALTTAKFSAAIRQRLSKQLEIETKLDLNNIQHKLDENKSSLHDAGGRVAGILGKIKLSKLTRNLDTTLHPILRAMQILANHEHCEVEFEGVEVADYDTYYDCLLSVANRSHLAIRRVALELGWWQTCSQAMIAFDKEDGNPYVVVPEGVSKVYVINPVTLERELLTAEIANRFGYNALALHAVYPKRKLDWRDILRLTLSSSKHHLILLLFVSLIAAVMGMLPPILTGQLIGQIIPKNEVDYLIQIPIILISSGISIALFGLVKQLLIISIESQATQHNQAALFHRILYLPMQFFRKYTVGDLANRAFAFENISKTITGANINGFLTIAYSFFSFFLMLYYAWQLALIVCVVMIIVIALLLYFTRIEMILTLKSAEADANSSALAYQILYG
ncbi:MAG: hypothetical protein K0U12_07225, partial [Gammaproteobacteria bacterium]|nr:hypothetical protein [Gammaproteobacteria bacterium]